MAYTIYDKNGNERLALIEESLQPNAGRFVEPQLEYNGTWMGECFVTLNIKSPVPIDFAIGDYVMYRGEKFVINYDPSVIKKATKKSTGDAFCYDNVKFSALSYELSDIRMLDYVIDGNNLHWNGLPRFSVFCPSIEEFADRLQANTDRWCHENGIGPAEKWFFITPTRNLSVARAASGEVSSSDKATASDTATSIYVTAFDQGTDVDDIMLNQNVSIDNMTVWDAMKYIKETFGLNFIVRGRAVIIGAAGIPVDGIFQYGKDNGLYEIERVADSEQQIVTKLFAYGTDKNLPTRYYADLSGSELPNNLAVNALMLPGFPTESLFEWVVLDGATNVNSYTGQATWNGYTAIFSKNKEQPFIQSVNAASLGIREATKYFDGSDGTEEVYPSITAFNTNTVYSAQVIEDAGVFPAGQEVADFTITLSSFGANDFVLSNYITAESAISMLDGSCGGRDFQIVSATQDEETLRWTLTCHRVHDESLDLWFPYSDGVAHGGSASANELYQIHSGDHFVFVGIEMPEEYVEAASERLLEGALQFLAKNDATRYTYIPKVDEIYMARQSAEAEQGEDIPIHDKIKEGGLMLFEDTDLGISTNAVFIDTLRIKEYGNQQIPTYEVTLRNEKQVGTIQRIQEQIGKITSGETSIGGGTGGSVNIPLVKSLIQTYGTDLFLRKDRESTAAEIIRFLKGIKFGSSNQWYINGDGEAVLNSLNVDNLNALNAHFAQLIIDEIKSVGGMVILTAANAKVHAVDATVIPGAFAIYTLYYKANDENRKIYQSFVANDMVVCAHFNAAESDYTLEDVSNKFYWYIVTSVSSQPTMKDGQMCHWVRLSAGNQTQHKGEGVPAAGDEIALLGHWANAGTNDDRKNAIVISAYDIDWLDTGYGQEGDSDYVPKLKAPFVVQYAGINNFTLYNKRVNVISHGYNVFKGDFKANTGEDLMETISQIEEGRLSFTHQAWAANAVEKADHGWTLTGFKLAYFSGAKYMCFLSDHTEGEAHLNETIFSSAPQPSANPPIPKKNWMPVDFEIISEDYTYAITNNGNKPADSAFIYTESNLPTLQKGQYLWIKCDLEYSNGLTSTSYSVSNIGEDGEAGIDGVGSYLYIAYATSADGSQGFSKTDTGGKTYIGVYRGILLHPNDIPEDPDDYTIYKWSRYVGDAGLNGLSAPPAYKETTVPHYLVYASGTGVTKSTSGWVDNTAPALTDEKPYLWRYDTTTYENVGGVENLLKNSTNPAQNALTDTYIAKIRLADGKQLVNGETYSIVLNAEDLSVWSVTSCTIRVYYNRSSNKFYTQATGVKQEADGTIRATFTANVDTTAGVTQWGIYVSAVGLVRPDTAYPVVYWVMLTEGDVQYSWMAAPIDLKKETTPAVVATKGRGIGQITEYYARNNSNTTPPETWGTDNTLMPTASQQYVWNREIITYTDGQTEETDAHVILTYFASKKSEVIKYAVTSSSSQPEDSAFASTTNNIPPTVNIGQYLWVMTETTYADNSKSRSYSVSYKGTNGTSPVYADIDNEMDSIACTSAGVPSSAQTVSTKVSMWNGSTKVSSPTIKVYDDTTSGAAYTSGTAKNGITATWSASTGSIFFAFATSVAAFTKKVFCITVSKSINGTTETRELYFTVNGIKAAVNGTDGANAVIYNIVPEKDSINVARDGSAYVPANVSITCGYVKNDGGTATKVNDVSSRIDSKYNLYFRRRTRSNQAWETKYYLYNNGTTSYKSYLTSLAVATYDAVEFVLSTATAAQPATGSIGTVIDRETVPIVADGEEGNGISGAVVAYGKSSSGTTQPTSWQSTIPSVPLGQYLWTRVTTSYTDGSADTVSYSISRIGTDGAQGTPGATGANGQTTYLHIAYANSADGSVNFDTSYFTGASYIGTRTDFDIDDPNDHTKYEWAELRGMDNAGVYVTAVKNYYRTTSTNATPLIDDNWVLCPPGAIPQPTNTNRYLWNYEVTEYGCQYPNMVLNSDNPTIGDDPNLFRFNSTNEFVHGEVYSFAMKLGQLPSPKTYYVLKIQGPSYKDGVQTSTSHAIWQNVGQNPAYPTRLVPNEEGIISGTFECNLHFSDEVGDINQTQRIWVSAYPEGGTYDVPSFDWITIVKGTQVASWSKALSELTQTIPPHLIATQGEKGDSAWVADLTNEMDSVQCDDTGYVVSQQSVSTALSLFYGVTEKNFGTPTVKRNGSTITIGTATNGVTVTYSNKVLTVAYDTAAKITGKDEFAITITATDDSSTVRTLTFTVNGIKGDVYNLLPSFEEIKATRDDNGSYVVSGSNIVSLTCGYTKNINGVVTTGTTDLLDDASKTLDLEGRYNIYFRRRNRLTQAYASSGRWYRYTYATYRAYLVQTETEGVTSGGLNIDTYDAVDFVISTNTANYVANASLANVIDRETVYVVADGLKGGKGDFNATVFKRQNTKPSTPTSSQGTYSNPVPDGWSDGIPAGGEMVWATTRTFKVDDTSTAWSEPRQMTDTMTYDVEFAYEISENATPVAPNENNSHKDASPYGYEGQIWFDPAKDKYSAQGVERDFTTMAWRAERDCTNGVWSDWTIVRIKGERGSIITGAVLTRSYTASQWETYSSKSPTEQTYWVDDDDNTVLTLCEKGDIFIVQGEATDTHDFYQLYYRYDHPYSGSSTSESTRKRRYCFFVSYTKSMAGGEGPEGPQGPSGNDGRGIATGYPKEKYLISNLNTGITVAGNTWSESILTPTEDKPYLWNYEETLWTDNTTTNSTPHILTTYTRAAAGDAFISGVYNWYVVTGQSSGVTRSDPADGTWVKCPPNETPVPTAQKRYLWNYEETVWDAPEQGRNLIKSYTQLTHWRIAICTLSTTTLTIGATYTASIRLTVPANKTYVRFSLYGKINGGTSNDAYTLTSINVQPGTQTVTASFTIPTYTSLVDFRVYCGASGVSSDIAAIEWIKLEKGALPTPYSEAPENLTTYTDPHVVCIHGESGADAEVYTLSPVEEVAGVQLPQDGGINSTIRQLVVGLSYKILKVEGASYEEISPRPDNNSDGFFLRFKRTYVNGTTDANPVLFETSAHVPTLYYTFTYSNYTAASNQPTAYTVELVRKAGNAYTVLDTRIVYVSYIASAAFEVDKKLHEIRSIVQGSSFDGNGGLQKDVSSVTERADTIETKVEQQRTDINNIQNTYATQSLVTQTATEIRSQVYGGMINGANLLLRSKEQASGFDSSLSTAAVQGQTNKYFACFSFGNIKPTGTDTILVSWQQTNVSGLTYRVMLYGKYPSGEYGTFKASGNLTTSANGYYARKFSLEGYTAEKVVIYATATSPSSLTKVAWAKAEFCDANATTADATGWTPAIEETGSEIKQTADEIVAAVEGTGVSISKKQITLNGDTQINGTLTLSNTGDGFMLRSDSGSALITPESIGSYNSFNTTTYTSSPQYHQEAGGFYKESNYYRTIPYSMYINIGTFSSNSEIKVESLTFSHIVLTDNYPSVTGTEVGTITFYEGSNEESYPLTTGTTYSYTTSANGASVSIRISGYFKVASGTTSYTLLDSLKSGNIVTMFGFTLRTPVQGAFVRVASDGLGVNAGNGKTAYFGPDGFHITPLLQNVKTITANYTASFTDDIIMVNNSSTVTLTLPTNGAIPEGKKIYVKKMTSSSTLRVQATFGSSGMIYKCNSASAVAYEDSTSPVMTYYISFDTGSGIGWLQGYCG